ncbi:MULTISPECIES: DUF6677 family protein [unclassified Paenibacillus]|uniref:DUF6677 family protein n=1 Tax=unclassified Paenibacillus TaxID=185978 RepID=UPI00070C1639|nr:MULTISPECIES: DUF6677 family protein [unclassified Paenibacillus]KQX51479.1 hypothetical protein ASD40_35185 [Paenibacillus sp. Root444D2]KRE38690.1 hypothetical protein ASG85_35530 [Paenibacillus sp. Soil724D2]
MNLPQDNPHIPEYSPNPSFQHYPPYYPAPRKRKWVAGVLSFIVPGTGHFYLGLMQRGLFIMMLLILDIFIITSFASRSDTSVPMVTLFALFIPVIYFYNLFDALQTTDNVNRRNELGEFAAELYNNEDPLQKLIKGTNLGVILIAAGVLFFLLSNKPRWFTGLFDLMGSYIGSVILVLAGLAMYVLDSRKNK